MNPMGYVVAVLYGVCLLALSYLVYRLGLPRLYTRKLVHIGIGLEFFILNDFFGPSLAFVFVCLAFTAALMVDHRFRIFHMMASDGDNDPGSVYYGLSMLVMAAVCYAIPSAVGYFGAAVLVLSLGDGLAGIVGASVHRHNPILYRNKTLFGSLAMVIGSFAALLLYRAYSPLAVGECLCVALLACGCEALSRKGRDNLFVPLVTFFYLLLTRSIGAFSAGAFGIALTPLLVVLMLRLKKLTLRGAIAAALINLVVSLSLGDRGFLLLMLYFALCALADNLKLADPVGYSEKGECRDEVQVLANGFVGAMCAFLFFVSGARPFLYGFLIAFAESLGDTVASGIGSRSRRTYDIFRRRAVVAGTSGGVSLLGSLSSLIAILLFCSAFCPLFFDDFRYSLSAGLLAYLGVFVDSLLGSLVQMQHRCTVCDRLTERRVHCGRPTRLVSGRSPFDNDLVNFLSGAAVAFLGCLAFWLLG